MRRTDGRKLGRETLEKLRMLAIDRIRAGERPIDLARTLGLHPMTVYRWVSRFASLGRSGLKSRKATGRPKTLSPFQLRRLFYVLVDSNPIQLKFPFALWTCGLVKEYIRREFNVELHRTTVNRILARLGFSFQKPLTRAYEQDMDLVKAWREREFPKIAALAKKEGAEIFFEDETGVRSDAPVGKTWGRIGKTPIVPMTGRRFSFNLVSAISPKGELRFMVVRKTVNAARFLEFLRRLLQGHRRKIILIVDGHPAHRSSKVKAFVKEAGERLRLFFLPPYSPELNPDELVWNSLKGSMRRYSVAGPEEMMTQVVGHMARLQRRPSQVRAFFQEKHVRYVIS
jgi:transposase